MIKNTFIPNVKREIAWLTPRYFALVMATGIVSIAAYLYDFNALAQFLFYFNILTYLLLSVVFIIRLFFFYKNLVRDFYINIRSPGFLTMVAATAILGNQFIYFTENYSIATYLYFFSFALWVLLIYLIFAILISKPNKPSIAQGINGIWLLFVVSTASLSFLGCQLIALPPISTESLLFSSLLLFLLAGLFYFIIITLIVYRLAFFKLNPIEFLPTYWINMGAVAILTLAGTALTDALQEGGILASFLPFVKGLTLSFWAFASWWIPLIIILEIWRHGYKKTPIVYTPQRWGMVFPLGMYTVCTYFLAKELQIYLLDSIASTFIYLAIIAWGLSILGLFKKIRSALFH